MGADRDMHENRPGESSASAADADEICLVELFATHRERLRRMVRLRMDPRLFGRIDPSDVIQEAYLEAHRRRDELPQTDMSPFLWLRLLAGQKLVDLHRFHLGAQKRDARREISLHRGPLPEATSASLAAHLLGRLTTASRVAMRAELRIRVEEALNQLAPHDREILALRHFEGLSNAEAARVLSLSINAASNRYVRALTRMKEILAQIPSLSVSW